MKKYILFIIVLTAMFSCAAQNSNKMKEVEKFNYEYYKSKLPSDANYAIYTEEDGTLVQVSFNEEFNSIVTIKPLTFKGYTKTYYKNGFLKSEGEWLYCSDVGIGIGREYNKNGKLIREVDEDKKFENLKVTPKELLRWMEKQGWIDLRTGKGQQTSFSNTPFDIYFVLRGSNHAKWSIHRRTMFGAEKFVIDAETGELISHENVYSIE